MQLALFAAEREVPKHAKAYSVQVRLDAMQIASAAAMGRLLGCLLVVRGTRRVIRRLISHQPFYSSGPSDHGPRTGPNILHPRI
jgi:hypothetical protein